jgi:N-acetyl-anhydromuramyl-L-alanine amidase AmpD
MDPGGFNAYKLEPPKPGEPAGENHGARRLPVPGGMTEPPRPLDLPALQEIVDQFVIHYDDEGISKRCFAVLQRRHLSVHFLLDLDGTIYQTLDLRERAYHATIANSRSVGVEMAGIGAFSPDQAKPLKAWYQDDTSGRLRIVAPPEIGDLGQHRPGFIARPARPQLVQGTINGHALEQHDFTPEQYAALIKLTAALHRALPRIKLDYPRDAAGRLITHKLSDKALDNYHGILGHFHIQTNKIDPGPALQWDVLIEGPRRGCFPPKGRVNPEQGGHHQRRQRGEADPDEKVRITDVILDPTGGHAGQHHAQRHETRADGVMRGLLLPSATSIM